jgi:hypothetical protein
LFLSTPSRVPVIHPSSPVRVPPRPVRYPRSASPLVPPKILYPRFPAPLHILPIHHARPINYSIYKIIYFYTSRAIRIISVTLVSKRPRASIVVVVQHNNVVPTVVVPHRNTYSTTTLYQQTPYRTTTPYNTVYLHTHRTISVHRIKRVKITRIKTSVQRINKTLHPYNHSMRPYRH